MLPFRLHHVLGCHALVFAFLGICAIVPAMAGPRTSTLPRINAPIDESSRTVLTGNVPPLARSDVDRGEAPAATQLTSMRLVLSHSAQQKAAMDAFMARQLDPSSPDYHQWLTPQQFGELYGPAESDIAAIIAWLQSHGLNVDDVPPARNNIAFSGTVAQVEAAFRVSIHSYNAGGQPFLSNTADPTIPTALAPVVSGVAQLNTIHPRPHNIRGRDGQFDPATHRLVPLGNSAVRPELTTGSGGSYNLYLVPADAATIYDTPNSFNAAFASGGTSYTGSGVTIGVVGDALIQAGTVVDYRSKFLNDSTAPTINNVAPAATMGGDTDEGYLDVEIAGGLAPGASLVFYTSSDLPTAIAQAIKDPMIDILSVSFGECELALGTSGNQLLSGWWQQASMAGIAVVVSTGDSGSADCDDNNTETSAIHGLQVSGFASTPYNIAVGGTDFSSLIGGFTTYVNTANSTSATTPYLSAKSYIPEAAWNDSTVNDTGSWEMDIPFTDPMKGNATNIIAGGGGVSGCSTSTGSTCTSGYAKPGWQQGSGVPGDGARDVPDVALFSGNGFDGASWLVCTDDAASGGTAGQTDNCVAASNSQFAFAAFGGTSTAAPAFAGILALVEQKTGGRLGLAAQPLYNLFNSTRASAVFHDVATGNNSVVCTAGSTSDCQKNTAGNYFLTGYDTTAGYDLATGMGSVDATQLVNNWGSVTGSGTATLTLTPSATAISSIQPLTVTVMVAGSGSFGTPTGTVTLTDNANYNSSTALVAGAASFTIAAGTLQAGTDALTATYSGDANYAITSASVNITVTAVSYALSATTPASVTPGNTVTSTLTVSSSNGYSGSVALTCAVTSQPANAANVPGCTISGSPVVLSSAVKSGTATVTLNTQAPIATLTWPRTGAAEAAGTAVLALLVFFGIPSRRRAWRAMVGLVAGAFVLLSVSACGSTTTTGSGGNSNPGTTPGVYTYTVTGTGTPPYTPAPTTTISLSVTQP
jgi:subtilase family serine protease